MVEKLLVKELKSGAKRYKLTREGVELGHVFIINDEVSMTQLPIGADEVKGHEDLIEAWEA